MSPRLHFADLQIHITYGRGEHQSYHQLDGIGGYHLQKDELCCGGEGEFRDGVHEYVE